ncbi:ATP-binding cassette domain-containing protein, partial [Anaerospora hongkongensis]|uniref:ATP-binding cassette domain-containing protein n=1 Tax=Anaerospora hongkongensis TaxID=244830 RepID=UPI002897A29A
MENTPILQVQNLTKHFTVATDFFGRPSAYLKAVDDVSFFIRRGETLGLVGESGCGKSTLGRTIIHLYKPTAGAIFFNGQEIKNQQQQQLLRSAMQMIFQDPFASLNPRMRIGSIIEEPMKLQLTLTKEQRKERVKELLQKVGLPEDAM